MNFIKTIVCAVLVFVSSSLCAQVPLTSLIDKTEEFITEQVEGYETVRDQPLEHEQFDVLIFEDKQRELSFFFTFYRGDKLCNMIRSVGPTAGFKNELNTITKTFSKVDNNRWENADKTIQVRIEEVDGLTTMVVKGVK